jgi:hypothetical protein
MPTTARRAGTALLPGVAEAQSEARPRVESRGYPGQLEGIGQDLVLLRALGRPLMGPALGQDRPVRVGAVHYNSFPRRYDDDGGVQLEAELRTQEVKHHPFRAALLSGIPGRNDSAGGGTSRPACPGAGACSRQAGRLGVRGHAPRATR